MTTDEAIRHFGSPTALARALGMDQSSIYSWKVEPPKWRQLQIQAVTRGRLKASPECNPKVGAGRRND